MHCCTCKYSYEYAAEIGLKNKPSLHVIPSKDVSRGTKWIEAINKGCDLNLTLKPRMYVCSQHFTADSYRTPVTDFKPAIYLKPEAVPSLFGFTKLRNTHAFQTTNTIDGLSSTTEFTNTSDLLYSTVPKHNDAHLTSIDEIAIGAEIHENGNCFTSVHSHLTNTEDAMDGITISEGMPFNSQKRKVDDSNGVHSADNKKCKNVRYIREITAEDLKIHPETIDTYVYKVNATLNKKNSQLKKEKQNARRQARKIKTLEGMLKFLKQRELISDGAQQVLNL